ncbi:AMP-binding protein, partial [Francisella sciaenopsi]|uniref:AMP-binding protein n=1 Tax=Francisella sciaenopsi TaxID=3055034 RepID=UPI0038B3DF97
AYVPMDPEYPVERFRHILADTEAKLIITQSHIEQRLKEVRDIELISIDDQDKQVIYDKEEITNLPRYSQSTDLAYVIYTSGTTGLPKGVMVSHSSVINLSLNKRYLDVRSSDTFAFLSSTIFDASIFEIFVPIMNGAKLCIPTDQKSLISSVSQFKSFIAKNNITILWLTKTLFDTLSSQSNLIFVSIKYLIIGGEQLNEDIINKLLNDKGASLLYLINGYGPTESTTFTTMYVFDRTSYISCPIGKPLNNIQTYILDHYMKPVPVGVI